MTDAELAAAAVQALENAYAPYSGFRVGAAILTTDGRVYAGANVENASLGLSVCAERNAVMRAVGEGARDFAKMVVVTDSPGVVMPCGMCRQIIWEFCRDLPILIKSTGGGEVRTNITELLPKPFTSFKR